MSCEIYDYRNHAKPKAAWENMEPINLMRKQGVIPEPVFLDDYAPYDEINARLNADTAPCEMGYEAPESDSA